MGWCAEFGCQIRAGCEHPMVAGRKACSCAACAVVCKGKFDGCPEVWAAGPKTLAPVVPRARPAAPPTALSDRIGSADTPRSAESPPPAGSDEALRSLRSELDGVKAEVADSASGLLELRGAVDDLRRTTQESIDLLRGELHALSELLSHQQAALTKMAGTHAASAGARASYEKLVAERRARFGAVGEEATRAPFPRIQRTPPNGHHDPATVIDAREADGQPR